MAHIYPKPTVSFQVTITMNEDEARALDAIVGYGFDSFYETFTKHMGEAYIKGHKVGCRALFESVRAEIPSALTRIDEARKALKIQS